MYHTFVIVSNLSFHLIKYHNYSFLSTIEAQPTCHGEINGSSLTLFNINNYCWAILAMPSLLPQNLVNTTIALKLIQ